MKARQVAPTARGKALWLMLCIAILVLGFGTFILLANLRPEPSQRMQPELIPAVRTQVLSYRNTPLQVSGDGNVSPLSEISVAAQVGGELVYVSEQLVSGGHFAAGELMLQIDPRDYETALAEAEADLAASRSNLALINTQLERLERLRAQSFAAQENLDEALSRRDQTLATIARQEATISNRRLALERSSVRAPFDGFVLSRSIASGDIVSPGQQLARFYSSAEMEIRIALRSADAAFIPGLWSAGRSEPRPASVRVNHGGLQYQWPGYLHRVEADIDQHTRTVDVIVRVPAPSEAGTLLDGQSPAVIPEAPPLLPGMYATVSIEGIELPEHFTVPVSALRNNDTIWVATPENRLRIEAVTVIREEGDLAVLLAPQLRPGAAIIISDIALVSDGMRISITDPEAMQ